MKVATILYHKNILNICEESWIKDCVNSILNQTFRKFTIYEINYGDDDYKLKDNFETDIDWKYYQRPFKNHAEAMNFLFEKCEKDNIDYIFNNNMDDYSRSDRFQIQLTASLNTNIDICCTNFIHINSKNEEIRKMDMSEKDFQIEFDKEHNMVCHPSVLYSKNFYTNNRYIPEEIPEEDFSLWKRTLKEFKYKLLDEYLIYYRIHPNQITYNEEIEEEKIDVEVSGPEKCACGEIKKENYNYCTCCGRKYI
jgi:hypothetical protein